jgi:hypothetical protein
MKVLKKRGIEYEGWNQNFYSSLGGSSLSLPPDP